MPATPIHVLDTSTEKTLNNKIEVRLSVPGSFHPDVQRASMSYATALALHNQLAEVLGLRHPAPASPLTASVPAANPRGDQPYPRGT